MFKTKSIFAAIFVLVCLASHSLMANELDKSAKAIFDQVELELKQLKSNNQMNSASLKVLVNATVLPYIDSKYFTYKVLGKNLEKMTQAQRSEFVDLLTKDLVGNYAESLKRYNNEMIVVVSSTLAPSGKLASVTMKFVGHDKPINAVTKWRLSDKESRWYIYDFVVEGVSLLQTKQKELAHQLLNHGVDSTIERFKHRMVKG